MRTLTFLLLGVSLASLLATSWADVPVDVLLPGNKRATATECQSWWCPMLLQTSTNTTLLYGACKFAAPSRSISSSVIASTDAGNTWSAPAAAQYLGQAVYSKTSGAIIMAVPCDATKNGTLVDCTNSAERQYNMQRAAAQHRAAPPRIRYHGITGSNPNCPDCIQPSALPKLSPLQLSLCQSGVVRSTDDGKSWSEHVLMNVSNSVGPHYAGGGLNHGIQLQGGSHPGRLAMARRFDCPAAMGDHGDQAYFHDAVLYSDDDGLSWSVGELLPQGWTETQVAEMQNGSLLLTTRTYGDALIPDPQNATSRRNKRRGFARSDDGGESWAQVWYVMDRQPEIGLLQPTCAQALVSDPSVSGTMYWAHPGNDAHSRANYTLHTSHSSGAEWEVANRIYPGGAGYSDALILRRGDQHVLAMAFQKTFDCPTGDPSSCGVPGIEGGGYDMAVAYYPI